VNARVYNSNGLLETVTHFCFADEQWSAEDTATTWDFPSKSVFFVAELTGKPVV